MNKDKVKTFADKVYGDMAGAMGVGMAYVGVKTGLYRAMRGRGPMQASEVVDATGLQPRYVEEWLKGMTASGYLEYDNAADTYLLPEEHAFLLASEGTATSWAGCFISRPPCLALLRRSPIPSARAAVCALKSSDPNASSPWI